MPAWAAGYQFPLCLAQDAADALNSPRVYQPFFTADPAYDNQLHHADAFWEQGREPGVWYVPTQVSKSTGADGRSGDRHGEDRRPVREQPRIPTLIGRRDAG